MSEFSELHKAMQAFEDKNHVILELVMYSDGSCSLQYDWTKWGHTSREYLFNSEGEYAILELTKDLNDALDKVMVK